MKIPFTKYQGTGNDFVLIDNRQDFFPKNDISLISAIAKSKFGVGADGVILLENFKEGDFNMIYYKADGSQSLCGNGSRCAVQFAKDLSNIEDRAIFQTFDGIHDAFIRNGMIYFSLLDVNKIDVRGTHYFMNNGSPHYVEFVKNVDNIDVFLKGSSIRNSSEFAPGGTNVNFVEVQADLLKVRTYERGVEAETLSCGTGVTASALVAAVTYELKSPIQVMTRGGLLTVTFEKLGSENFHKIYLAGPALKVFEGSIDL